MGAGIPRGRFIEAVGDPATTKSAFGVVCAAAFQRAGGIAIYLDTEGKLEKSWAEGLGLDFETLGYDKPKDLHDAVSLIGQVAKTASTKIPTVIVWDSIAATPGAQELEDATSEEGMPAEKAARARYLSGALRATMMELSRRGVTLIGINQLRITMNFWSGSSGKDSPGGRAIKYHAGLRLMFKNRGRMEDKSRGIITGIAVEVEAVKNTCSRPFRKAQLKFRFKEGFDTFSGLPELLIRHERITKTAGWCRFKGKKFREEELESIAAEMPELLAPIDEGNPEPEPETPGGDSEPSVSPASDPTPAVSEEATGEVKSEQDKSTTGTTEGGDGK